MKCVRVLSMLFFIFSGLSARIEHCSLTLVPKDAETIDCISAVIYGPEGTDIVMHSEARRASVDGRPQTLKDIILQRLVCQDAVKYQVKASDESVDRYLANMKESHDLNDADIRDLFLSSGYTMDEGREELKRMDVVNSLLNYRVRTRVIVTENEVRAFCEKHPDYIPARYKVQKAVFPFEDDRKQQKKKLEKEVSEHPDRITFKKAYWASDDELPENSVIRTVRVGVPSSLQEDDESFYVFRIQEKVPAKKRAMKERYRDVVDELRFPKYKKLLDRYYDQLLHDASILYLKK